MVNLRWRFERTVLTKWPRTILLTGYRQFKIFQAKKEMTTCYIQIEVKIGVPAEKTVMQ